MIQLPEVSIVPRAFVPRILAGGEYERPDWFLSFGDAEISDPVGAHWPPGYEVIPKDHRLYMPVFDLENGGWGGMDPPSEADVRTVWHFCLAAKQPQKLLVNCAAGVSRSSAAALIFLATRYPPEEAVQRLFECVQDCLDKNMRPPTFGDPRLEDEIFPNRLIIWHAERLMGLEGQLRGALSRRIGPQFDRGFIPPDQRVE